MYFAAAITALAGLAAATPINSGLVLRRGGGNSTVVKPGPIGEMIVNSQTTINSTRRAPGVAEHYAAAAPLPLSFVNTYGQDLNAYITGQCANGDICFIGKDGNPIYQYAGPGGEKEPVSGAVAIDIPAGATINLTIPALTSARIWFAAGDLTFAVVGVQTSTGTGTGLVQPAQNNPNDASADVLWGFVEFNLATDGTIFANVSYVDFVGMVLGIQMEDNNGPTQTTKGLQPGAASKVCAGMRDQAAADDYPWDKACMTNSLGDVVRVLSITDYTAIDPNGFADYWTGYVDQVYSAYSTSTLTVKGSACTVANELLTCEGDETSYAKPSAVDIWGCNSGPFANGGSTEHLANLAVLCAAFHRSTFLIDGDSEPSPQDLYYTTDPTDHYSRLVHQYETDGKGYAFSYDDVADGGENPSGTVASSSPKSLLVWVGGAPSDT